MGTGSYLLFNGILGDKRTDANALAGTKRSCNRIPFAPGDANTVESTQAQAT